MKLDIYLHFLTFLLLSRYKTGFSMNNKKYIIKITRTNLQNKKEYTNK